jgi:hypothetical protein
MRRTSVLPVILAVLLLWLSPGSLPGQTPGYPDISARQYASGSAKVKVTGAFQIDQDIAINASASYSDGEMTWLQFGNSGAATPNALITYGDGEAGIGIGLGKWITTAGGEQCRGKAQATSTMVSAEYVCAGIDAYNAGSGKMGKVDITVQYRAGS